MLEVGKTITDLFAFKHHAEVVDKCNIVAGRRREGIMGTGHDVNDHRPG